MRPPGGGHKRQLAESADDDHDPRRRAVGQCQFHSLRRPVAHGQYRLGLTGDAVAGGAFTTGFVVVPTGNIIYARPGYKENPLNPQHRP